MQIMDSHEVSADDRSSPAVIRGSRWGALRQALVSLCFVAGGALIFKTNGPSLIATSAILIFGLNGLVSLYRVVVPGALTIDSDGFAWNSVLRSWRVTWNEVVRFRILYTRRTSRIMIDYGESPNARPDRPKGRRPRSIPVPLVMSSTAVFDILQARLEKARQGNTDQHPAIGWTDQDISVPEPKLAFPTVSLCLLAILSLVFAAEIRFPITDASNDFQPSVATLIAFGGSMWTLVVGRSEWYRIVTAPFLHGSLIHLLFNGVALIIAGRLLEGLVGRVWFAAIYAVGAITGALVSLALNKENVVSVGASGAIMALFAAIYVCSLHFARTSARDRLQQRAIGVLIPTLLTIGKTSGGMTVDFGAHLGGAAGGALMGIILLRLWGDRSDTPSRPRVGLAIAAIGGLAIIAALLPAARAYRRSQLFAELIPNDQYPADAQLVRDVADFERRFPKDPRPHLVQAVLDVGRGNPVQAEAEARLGLSDPELLKSVFEPKVESALWMVLGEALAKESKKDDARNAFDKALAVDPAQSEVYRQRAMLRFSEGAFDEALSDVRTLIARVPNDAGAHDLEGDILFAKGDLHAAIASYDAAIAIRPSFSNTFLARGVAKYLSSDAPGAMPT